MLESRLADQRNRRRWAVDVGIALALLAGNLLLIGPYLATDFSAQPWNNDYTYIAIARMFRDRPWTWSSLQYCGAPFAYVYPPIFHILVAFMPVDSLGRAFHLVSSFGYGLVPVALYIFGLQLFRSRLIAVFAAVVYSFLPSPVYYLLPVWRNLAHGFAYAPWPFIALTGYSEAAHTASLVVTLLALAAAWRSRWRTASFCAAAVFLLNWPGTVALFFGLAAIAVARARDLGYLQAASRVIGIAGVGYGLSAFWMSPGFFSATTLLNRVVLRHEQSSAPWNATTWAILLAAAGLIGMALWRRTPPAAAFLLAWVALSGFVVATFSLAGNYILPLPHRYVAEFNLGLVLSVAWLAGRGGRWRLAIMVLTIALGGFAAREFLRHPWKLQPRGANSEQLLAFQISNWLAQNAGSSRVFAAGELDGSLNAWTDVAQAGGSRQGVSNFLTIAAQREITYSCAEPGRAAKVSELWLRALDARYLVVHDARSREYFHWFVQPQEFAAFPTAWTDASGDTIYRLPPPEQNSAVVVDLATLRRLPRLRTTDDLPFLEAYASWAQGKRTARVRWTRADTAEVEADLGANEAVLVKVNYDRGWHASTGRTQTDPIGFLLIDTPPGHQLLTLKFGASWDVWLARAITLLTVALILARAPAFVAALLAVIPAALAYAVLMASAPSQIAAAEDAFQRIQPPMINPTGIVDSAGHQPPLLRGHPMTIYGLNFGSPREPVRVWAAGREAPLAYHGPNMLIVTLPEDAPPSAEVSVEVNGCRGNSFAVDTR